MHATFRQLQLFLALTETGSITAAARACHVTQPTVSMQLRDLADSVGLPLYNQLGKRLRLTEAGEALVSAAQSMSDEWAALEQKINGLKGLTQGRLRISVVSTAKYFVPGILGRFCARYPDIDIALQLLNRDGVMARLQDHRDDLYIMSMPPSDMELEQEMFLPNPLVVIASNGHPLAHRKTIPLATLAKERFILREQGSSTRMACDAHFDCLGFKPNVRLELGSNEAIKHSVAAGLGLAVLSRHAIARHPDGDGVTELKVRGFPAQSNWFILHPKDHRPSPIVIEFLAHLRASAKQLTASISGAVRT
ncbi:MAG: LysR family transcriptional regulator [Pseudomonadota bacterium]|nr:LysR family transcriptional regulator [Pseudomonadota bacterium]